VIFKAPEHHRTLDTKILFIKLNSLSICRLIIFQRKEDAMKTETVFPEAAFKVSSFSRCKPHPNFCVAVAKSGGNVAVRNSADRKKTAVIFTEAEWKDFVAGVKNGEFD
jgi:Domain of unknown function (DUF397)